MLKGFTAPRSPLGAAANGEELDALAPKRIEFGFRYPLSYSVSDLNILEGHGS
jgi:hypothetical protein